MTTGSVLARALTNTLLGMGTVFCVLIFMALVISLLPRLTGLIDRFQKGGKQTDAPIPVPDVIAEVNRKSEKMEEESPDDLELVAVITAAIAASEGVPADGFTVRSIRRSSRNQWKRV